MYRPPHIERNWIPLEHLSVPGSLTTLGEYPDIVYQTLVRRGFADLQKARQFIDYSTYPQTSPYELPDMDKAISRILRAIENGQLIGVWGDFDVDGQTSTAILVSTLRELGADHVYHIPVRGPETHGIGLEPLQNFLEQGVKVILTCDTGVSAQDAINYAQSRGVEVVVTDHHTLPQALPPAYALVNPHRLPAGHPLSTLPGAGTALKFAEALLTATHLPEKVHQLHDLAALGCVADLAELSGDTRYLVQSGLELLRTSPRPAVAALLQSAGVDFMRIAEDQISFTLAPRLNAVGRLSDANPMVHFLLSEDEVEIAVMVNQIEGLNAQRKYLCDQVFQGALTLLEKDRSLLDQPMLILHHPEWPAGIVGIVASRLVEIFHRPVILLVATPGQPLRGSARSVEGIDITAALTVNKDLLISFGGHPMAAGLSLQPEASDAFKRSMNKTINDMYTTRAAGAELVIDAFVDPSSITLDYARSLDVLSPYGPGNPALLLAAEKMRVVSSSAVGKLNEHLIVDLEGENTESTRFIWWNGSDLPMPEGKFDVAYTVHANNFRGNEQLQYEWIDYRQSREDKAVIVQESTKKNVNIDHRGSRTPFEDLASLTEIQGFTIWKEGTYEFPVTGSTRQTIIPCDVLAVWSVPPDINVLRQVLQSARPTRIHWFLIPPEEHRIAGFLQTTGKVVKEGLRRQQQFYQLADLAICSAVTVEIAALGLEWLACSGHISIIDKSSSSYRIVSGGKPDDAQRTRVQRELKQAFTELIAFSENLQKVDLNKLVDDLA